MVDTTHSFDTPHDHILKRKMSTPFYMYEDPLLKFVRKVVHLLHPKDFIDYILPPNFLLMASAVPK